MTHILIGGETVSKNKLDYAIVSIKKLNIRVTPQRVAILEYLLTSGLHPTVDEIYRAVKNKFPSICLTTIYNNLNTLCEVGLVRELKFGNTPSRFDGNVKEHYHIICNNCNTVIDLHYPLLKEIEVFAEQIADFKVSHHRFEVYGECTTCSA